MWFPRTAPPARKGTDPERDAVYLFKHALLQVFRSRRRELHARIAAVLEERFPEIEISS